MKGFIYRYVLLVFFLCIPVYQSYGMSITLVTHLRFPSAFQGFDDSITVGTSDRGTAVFAVTGGGSNALINATITSADPMSLYCSLAYIRAGSWTLSFPARLDSSGNARVYVGGTATIRSTNTGGQYTGTATLFVGEIK